MHKIALESIGRDRSDKDISDWANITWGKLASPKADCVIKRKIKTEYWERRLAQLDGKILLPEADVRTTPTRRKRSENDDLHENESSSKNCIRHNKVDSQPLSTKTNIVTPLPDLILTPPKSPPRLPECLPPKPPWETISNNTLVWFARPSVKSSQSCSSMASWKKRITREMRLHSLDSLLFGCGHSSGSQEGVIVIDECDEAADKWTTHIRNLVGSSSTTLVQPIVVYGCRSGVLFRLE